MNRKKLIIIINILFIIFLPQNNVNATSLTSNFTVKATVAMSCSISNITSMVSFGIYYPVGENATKPNTNAHGTFDLACTLGTIAKITLDGGENGGKYSGTTRSMFDGNDYLGYELYQNSDLSKLWDATGSVSYVPQTKAPTTFHMYGSIPAAQNIEVGNDYIDTVNITINF